VFLCLLFRRAFLHLGQRKLAALAFGPQFEYLLLVAV
jgi:hypothetical protein